MAFLNLGQVQEARAALLDEVEAIAALAKEEKRELSGDETKRCDELLAKHEAMAADEERCRKLEQAKAQAAANRQQELGNGPKPETDAAPRAESRSVPAVPLTPLAGFRGKDAHQQAHDVGQWIKATVMSDRDARQHCVDRGLIRADAQTADDFQRGGLFVPTEMSNAIIRIVAEVGLAGRLARRYPMSEEKVEIPKRAGGPTVYYPSEVGAVTSSETTWTKISLNTKDRAILTRLSHGLMRGSAVSVADLVTTEMGYSFAEQMDNEFFNGDGTSTYGGEVGLINAIGAGGINTLTDTSEDTWDEITLSHFTETKGLLPSKYRRDQVWVCSSNFYDSVMLRLLHAAGGNTIAALQAGDADGMFMGKPVYFTDDMPTSTAVSTIHCLYGSFMDAVILGDREQVSISSSEHRYFDTREIGILGQVSYDIEVHEAGDASNAGAYVALKTGAA